MGKLRNIVESINGEIIDLHRKSKKKIGPSILNHSNSVMQRLNEDADKRLEKLIQMLESDTSRMEMLRRLWLRHFKKAQRENVAEQILQAAEFKSTILSNYIEHIANYDPESIFQIFKLFAPEEDKNQLRMQFEIESLKAANITSRCEARLFELCERIAKMHEIFYKHYARLVFGCIHYELGQRIEEIQKYDKKQMKIPTAAIEFLVSQSLYDENVRLIRNAMDHNDLKYHLRGNYVEVPVKSKKSKTFTSAELMAVLKHIRNRESDTYHLTASSHFAVNLMGNVFQKYLPEFIRMLEHRRRISVFESA